MGTRHQDRKPIIWANDQAQAQPPEAGVAAMMTFESHKPVNCAAERLLPAAAGSASLREHADFSA